MIQQFSKQFYLRGVIINQCMKEDENVRFDTKF